MEFIPPPPELAEGCPTTSHLLSPPWGKAAYKWGLDEWTGWRFGRQPGWRTECLVKDHCLSLYKIPKPDCYLIPSCTPFRPIPIHVDLVCGEV